MGLTLIYLLVLYTSLFSVHSGNMPVPGSLLCEAFMTDGTDKWITSHGFCGCVVV